jgi:hypothetical protein
MHAHAVGSRLSPAMPLARRVFVKKGAFLMQVAQKEISEGGILHPKDLALAFIVLCREEKSARTQGTGQILQDEAQSTVVIGWYNG